MKMYDKIIIGAGLYGLYSALCCARNNEKVIVLETDDAPFKRASYANQARVHMGYHYPRSITTALKSKNYFNRFVDEFGFCILDSFDQIYATSTKLSWTNATQFKHFCRNAGIRCDEILTERFFKPGMCDGAFMTTEYTYDAKLLCDHLLSELDKHTNVEIVYNAIISSIDRSNSDYRIIYGSEKICAPFVLNATYSGVNQIQKLAGFAPFKIKYELCEIILCSVSGELKDIGITVMDGPFFSIMPFGKTGLHSLTSVSFTPHVTSFDNLPTFACQKYTNGYCSPAHLGNCNDCIAKPDSSWEFMSRLARKYLKDEYAFNYERSLYSMKPILVASEIDDSRPTVIRQNHEKPAFFSVLSGKINTIYDLDEVLLNDYK